MSSLPTQADKPADDPEVEKDVTVEGYLDPAMDANSWRDFAGLLVPDIDWYEKKTKTSTTPYLVLGDDRRVEVTAIEADEIRDALAEDPDAVAGVRVETDETTETNNRWSKYEVGWKARDRLTDEMPVELAGLTRDGRKFYQSGESVCSVSASVTQSRILEHRETRTDMNRYESDDEVWTVTLNFSLGPAAKSEVDEWAEAILGTASTRLGRWDAVGKVRVATCTEERHGDCFV
jgi:hypothetical protein